MFACRPPSGRLGLLFGRTSVNLVLNVLEATSSFVSFVP